MMSNKYGYNFLFAHFLIQTSQCSVFRVQFCKWHKTAMKYLLLHSVYRCRLKNVYSFFFVFRNRWCFFSLFDHLFGVCLLVSFIVWCIKLMVTRQKNYVPFLLLNNPLIESYCKLNIRNLAYLPNAMIFIGKCRYIVLSSPSPNLRIFA